MFLKFLDPGVFGFFFAFTREIGSIAGIAWSHSPDYSIGEPWMRRLARSAPSAATGAPVSAGRSEAADVQPSGAGDNLRSLFSYLASFRPPGFGRLPQGCAMFVTGRMK